MPHVPRRAATPGGGDQRRRSATTYNEDDLIGAAEGVFGKGAKGLAGLIEDIQEAGRAQRLYRRPRGRRRARLGVRYGSGTLYHKVEGETPVYWTGPSVGFDVGANAGKTFVLVYNLYDSQELYKRFPAGEGAAYFVGGFNASYLRRGDIVLIPIRVGVGAAARRQRRLYEIPQEAELAAVLENGDLARGRLPALRRGLFLLRFRDAKPKRGRPQSTGLVIPAKVGIFAIAFQSAVETRPSPR